MLACLTTSITNIDAMKRLKDSWFGKLVNGARDDDSSSDEPTTTGPLMINCVICAQPVQDGSWPAGERPYLSCCHARMIHQKCSRELLQKFITHGKEVHCPYCNTEGTTPEIRNLVSQINQIEKSMRSKIIDKIIKDKTLHQDGPIMIQCVVCNKPVQHDSWPTEQHPYLTCWHATQMHPKCSRELIHRFIVQGKEIYCPV